MHRTLFVLIIIAAMLVTSCATKTQTGAAVGAGAGAAAGAVIGNQSGNPRTGAAVGAVVGGAIGAAVGRRMDQQEKELRQIEGVDVTRPSEGQIDVRLTSDILFDHDSSSLRAESRATLRELADTFKRYSDINVIEVEGHTDSTGPDQYNHDLSHRRAGSVRSYLIEQGVSGSSISAQGFGETAPKASNSTADGRLLNRRVEIRIRARQA
jgi:outer membrane protein OmpA-like peptidoglycan-associated protein